MHAGVDTMRSHFLDLFSGLGGASEAFVNDDNWTVLRIDNNPLLGGVPFTVIDDVDSVLDRLPRERAMEWPKLDCIWASPPCREFSNGFSSPKSIAAREGRLQDYKPDLSLLETAIEIIQIAKPKYWVIENVVGAIRYFEPILGKPRQIIGPYVLWGNFPLLDVDTSQLVEKKKKNPHSSNPLRSNYMAKVDFVISEALKKAIENQKSIFDDFA
ncbi:MAG: site-specific DNA methylase [Virus sp.]|nr:MAG: site-specific DNA methylase [Virus sp.]